TLLAEAPVDAPPTPLPPVSPAVPEESVASGASGEDPGVVGAEPLGSLTCPAASDTLLTAAEPVQATAGASRPGHELPGVSLVAVGQPSSFPGGGPVADCSPPAAVAVPSAVEPEPGIPGDPLPNPQTPEPDREEPPSSCPAPGARDSTSVPLPDPTSAPVPALTPGPIPIPSTSHDAIAAPGDVFFSFPEDDPQGAAFVFPSPDPLGAAVLPPPPPPFEPGTETGHVAPVHRAPRRGSAPCLPVLVGHGAVPGAPTGDDQ
ncbi:vegetative cell wall protein gp1-like, partial [Terrapene carolina triunguis]|uniref:vegetative cell wall protein gp1-like n=1 Tax=Terrapene triunguis TaxID=2587831 RepID=UPI00115644B2